ncbi:MAG: PorT family protein [Hymenobacter sp.]|nr:MAG: PorT family protein [Hymenobacter sp.]
MLQRFTLLLTGSLLITSAAYAQTTFCLGPVVGLSGTTASQRSSWVTQSRVGLEAGLQGVIQFSHLAIQPSLRYSQKGWRDKSSFSGSESESRLDYLTLPLNFVYSLQSDGQGWHLLAGPYVGCLLGGKTTFNSAYSGQVRAGDYQPVPPVGSTYSDSYFHRYDAGLQAGLGYRFNQLLAQAAFSFGLYDTAPWWGSPKHRGVQLSLSYLFIPKGT